MSTCYIEHLWVTGSGFGACDAISKFISTYLTVIYKKKLFRKYFDKTHRWTLVSKYLFNKVADLQSGTLLERDSSTGVFLTILSSFLEHIFKEHLRVKGNEICSYLTRSHFKNFISNSIPFLCAKIYLCELWYISNMCHSFNYSML